MRKTIRPEFIERIRSQKQTKELRQSEHEQETKAHDKSWSDAWDKQEIDALENNKIQFEAAEKLLEAVNSASGSVIRRHITFITLCVYVGLIIAATTDVMLLKVEPVKLPIINIDIPIIGFYLVVPFLILFSHFDLLLQFNMLARKLHKFDQLANALSDWEKQQQLRTRPHNFHFAHLLGNSEQSGFMRGLYKIIIWITLVVFPLIILLWAQGRFVPYHDKAITWTQRIAVSIDIVLLWTFWPLIMPFNLNDNIVYDKCQCLKCWIRRGYIKWISIPCFLAALIAWCLATIPDNKPPWKAWPLNSLFDKRMAVYTFRGHTKIFIWCLGRWFKLRNLDLTEDVLTKNKLETETKNDLTSQKYKIDKSLLREVDGLILKDRDLRFSNFSGSIVTKADFSESQLQYADLSNAQLQEAKLKDTQLQYANLSGVRLQRAKLSGASLQGVNLNGAQLQGADLSRTQLEGADLSSAELQGANVSNAQLQGANLSMARLQGIDFMWAELQGANLSEAQLQGANLSGAQLQGADLSNTQLQGADLSNTQLQSAYLSNAKLQGADLSQANLDYSNIINIDTSAFNQKYYIDITNELNTYFDIENIEFAVNRIKSRVNMKTTLSDTSAADCVTNLRIHNFHCFNLHQPNKYVIILANYLTGLACCNNDIAKGVIKHRTRDFIFLIDSLLAAPCSVLKNLHPQIKLMMKLKIN